ncbi:unnamed protein product [Ilex paraguariensis]|uniref:MPN domain-containing protein n=1 Tax=Ilex paraguariensis TaxID=185542 RepID=A0ABC8TIY9_9AQUA
MRPSSGRINVAASAQKRDVDNRFSLRYYNRIADNILKQADIFREEKNVIDLYVMLLRYSSLVSETIPCHRDYRASLQSNKISLKKKLLNALTELEELKPAVRQKIDELNRKHTHQVNGWGNSQQGNSLYSSMDCTPGEKKKLISYGTTKTIPCHRDYRASLQSNKISLKKKLLNALTELEELKPAVRQKIDELNRKHTHQVNGWGNSQQGNSLYSSMDCTPGEKKKLISYGTTKTPRSVAQPLVYQGPRTQPFSHAKPVEDRFRQLSLSIPLPKAETLSRHSILGPNGLRGQWQPPSSDKWVQYPSNIDFTPVEIPRENSLQQPVEDGPLTKKDSSSSDHERSNLESVLKAKDDDQKRHAEEPGSLISFDAIETPFQTEIIRQPSPPPVLASVQDLIPTTSPSPSIAEAEYAMENPSLDGLVCSESPMQLHISTALMDSFMKRAQSNTDKNLETCGVLAGSLKNRKFFITALIIPKQESTSDSCQTTNEEEIFEVQDKQSLFPLGWIHTVSLAGMDCWNGYITFLFSQVSLSGMQYETHPTQSCFMSSIDVHTHYSYQIMLPEAIAIVMAPKDSSRTHGIFRLTTPGGMSVIRQCPQRGFHPHDPPPDGGPIYKQCTDVYLNPNLKFEVIDLREILLFGHLAVYLLPVYQAPLLVLFCREDVSTFAANLDGPAVQTSVLALLL